MFAVTHREERASFGEQNEKSPGAFATRALLPLSERDQARGASQLSEALMPPSFQVQSICWYVKATSSYSANFMRSGCLLFAMRKAIDAMFALVSFTV